MITEDETIGWHHRLNGHESKQASGDGEGQGSLVFCSAWGQEESDMTECLNNNNVYVHRCISLRQLQKEIKRDIPKL